MLALQEVPIRQEIYLRRSDQTQTVTLLNNSNILNNKSLRFKHNKQQRSKFATDEYVFPERCEDVKVFCLRVNRSLVKNFTNAFQRLSGVELMEIQFQPCQNNTT